MTSPRTTLEQAAREWLERHVPYIKGNNVTEDRIHSLAALLAVHEADVLEEAAELVETIHPDCNASHMFRLIISNALRAKVEERRH